MLLWGKNLIPFHFMSTNMCPQPNYLQNLTNFLFIQWLIRQNYWNLRRTKKYTVLTIEGNLKTKDSSFFFFFSLQCGCAPKSLSLSYNSSQGRESIAAEQSRIRGGKERRKVLRLRGGCTRPSLALVRALSLLSLRLASRADGDAVLSRRRLRRRSARARTDRPTDRPRAASRTVQLGARGRGGPPTSPPLMLGYFRLFFFRPTSPMQTEICGEASPSSSPVCWGCAWLPA